MGRFKSCLCQEVKGMLSLYEASYLAFEGESILDEAKAFTIRHLKNLKGKIVLDKNDSNFNGGPRPFKFNIALCEDPKFEDLVSLRWNEEVFDGWKRFILYKKLKHLKLRIKAWQKKQFMVNSGRKDEIMTTLDILERMEENSGVSVQQKLEKISLLEKHEEILSREEIEWRQKSRVSWLKAGDQNTKCFHRMANVRGRINTINSIKEGETLVEDMDTIKERIINFYVELYSKECDWRPTMGRLDFKSISPLQQANLEKPFTEEEVERAISFLRKEKALGPGPGRIPDCVLLELLERGQRGCYGFLL
ncbi:uncharacterized protein LOC143857012 [Tasmannia lanceolata]|uniref:uncharacterized protein LOC143857012 n=1 Tax=Tasmannia lanceolata TaxID=3420 RepID=UPI0040649916